MEDDFNTPKVFSVFFDVLKTFNQIAKTPGKITDTKFAIAEIFLSWMRSHGKNPISIPRIPRAVSKST